jgi:thiopurine S-methyltransferase
MHTSFWIERWARKEIGFHQSRFNEYLVRHWSALGVAPPGQVFVPLCGKSLDMRWLREHAGHRVLGIEIARSACVEFFEEWDVPPRVARKGRFETFEARDVELLCGDLFDLTAEDVADVRAVFDRAALIALPSEMRAAYAKKLREVLPSKTPILLVAADYAQHEMAGPPFAVGEDEIRTLFAGCEIDKLEDADVTSAPDNARFRQRGLTRLLERVWRIR